MAELVVLGSEAASRQSLADRAPVAPFSEPAIGSTVNSEWILDTGRKNFDAVAKDLVRVFKLLADETRLRILLYLVQRDELHVRALCELLGHSQPAVSHHLALLRMAGLISARREGKHNYYHVLPARVKQLLDVLFADVPEANRRLRFEDYVLSYAPAR
jgi:ArsR family transcriptional regulator, arsenate/arsenite/antimonite-responsive transcriptional repressor